MGQKKLLIVIVTISFSFLVTGQVAPGTVIWSEDFDSGLPSTWQVVNNINPGPAWVWGTTYSQGQYSNCLRSLNSSTTSNGFMQLPMDFYNIGSIMPAGFDTYLATSVNVGTNTDLVLRFQHALRFCCSGQSKIEVQLSGDSISWTNFDVKNGTSINQTTPDVEEVNLTIPNSLLTGGKLYIRFNADFVLYFYWMIDDVEIVKAYTSAASVEKVNWSFGAMYKTSLLRPIIPVTMFDTMRQEIQIKNRGSLGQTNLKVHSSIFSNGGLGSKLYEDSITHSTLGVDSSVNLNMTNNYGVLPVGEYINEIEVFTTPSNQLSNRKKLTYSFQISDTTLSKNSVIQHCWANFELRNNEKLGTLYRVGNQGGDLTSISVYSGSNPLILKTYLKAELWSFNSAAPTLSQQIGSLIASSPIDTLDSSGYSSWVNFPLLSQITLTPNSEYLVVISNVGGSSQFSSLSTPMYYRANEDIGVVPPDSYVIRSSSSSWDTTYTSFYVNLNFGGGAITGLKEIQEKSSLTIFPNPNNGTIQLESNTGIERVQVYDLKGKLVKEKVNRTSIVNLEGSPKGVYLLRVLFERGEVRNKKVILH